MTAEIYPSSILTELCGYLFGYAAGKKCYVILPSGVVADEEEGSLRCHDAPREEEPQRREMDHSLVLYPKKHYRLPYATLESQTVVDTLTFGFWDESPRVDHHDNH
ncbi:hypothetical protein EYF80_054223 [Liparis tanakae]|uniref:Uncharacterized protein n=1 Tax=Liparis tanakae TaxID=230148 RepID=A0A4Z2F3Z9_9TELE|nr:hypothetical protein EYF80_054223 [Liparis tanakae]